ncbi:MAG: hypothetical protein R6W76_00700, partial [Caldilinea sp.]
PVAASGAWSAADTFTIQLVFYTTPFTPHITCRFEGDRLHYQFTANAAFERRARPWLTGRMR